MTVYLINIGLIVFWGLMLLHANPSKEKKIVYCVIVAVQWILISGLRHNNIGDDTWSYYHSFESVKTNSWGLLLGNCWDYLFHGLNVKDPGYYVLVKFFQIFFDDYQWFLMFVAIVFTGLMARWIYRYSTMPDISFLIYSVLFFSFFSITGIRQTLATALVVFLGYEFAKKRKIVKFIIIAVISFVIHKSSIVFVLYYLVANISFTPTYFLAVFGTTGILALIGSRIYQPIATALGFADELVNYSGGGAETFATVLLLLCFVAWCLYPWINKQRIDAKNLYNMLFLTMGSTVLLYHNQSFMRIQQYFSLVIMLIVPEIIRAIQKEYRVYAYLFVVAFLIVYFTGQSFPYRFFFM